MALPRAARRLRNHGVSEKEMKGRNIVGRNMGEEIGRVGIFLPTIFLPTFFCCRRVSQPL